MLPWKLDSFPNILISSWAKFQVLKPISHKFGKSVFPSKQFSWVEMLLLCVHSVPAYVVEKCLIEVLENLQASIQGKATYDFSWGYKARKILKLHKTTSKEFWNGMNALLHESINPKLPVHFFRTCGSKASSLCDNLMVTNGTEREEILMTNL